MIILLLDEPGVFVFDSPEAVAAEIEPPDIERELRAAYDEFAVPYGAEWISENKWGVLSVEHGEYRLVPAGAPDPPGLALLLEKHTDYCDPPSAKPRLIQLLCRLREPDRGAG